MNLNEWLRSAQSDLKDAGIATARLDSVLLAEYVTKKDRAWLLANQGTILTTSELRRLNNLLRRRQDHIPLAYLLGKIEFYGREFILNYSVLVPRPETETMIDLLKEVARKTTSGDQLSKTRQILRIGDIGTGCGAIGITAAMEVPNSQVTLSDIDTKALKLAKINVDKFTLNISIIKSDLLNSVKGAFDILLCNLPYVPDNFSINLAATREPKHAIFGGPDGLDLYRRLFSQLARRPNKVLYILTEALPPQHNELAKIANQNGYKLELSDDFIQVFKIEAITA